MLIDQWPKLARELSLPRDKIRNLQKAFHDTPDIAEIIVNILTEWRMNRGKTATLTNLISHLQNINWVDTAGNLSFKVKF